MRNRKWYRAHQLLLFVPLLGGERAMTRKLWELLPARYKDRFKIETGLNFFAKYYGKGFAYAILPNVKQVIKEKKYGFWNGFKQRIGMYKDVFLAALMLEFRDLPKDQVQGRLSLANIVLSLGAIGLGFATLYAASYGPVAFIRRVFRKELQEDPSAPLINLFADWAGTIQLQSFQIAGIVLIVLGIIYFIFSANRAYQFLTSKLKKG